ncbi:hypothetical protein ACNOYE_08370 [Nannocystaceae bacterium ST9]
MKRITTISILIGLALTSEARPAHACGPSFARSLLGAGDDALCSAPPLDFHAQLDSPREPNTLDTEAAGAIDLRAALAEEGRSALDIERIVADWQRYREHIDELDEPAFPSELPAEFELYLRGARAWHRGDHSRAAARFRELLELPAEQRRRQSVWAAYMLGRVAAVGSCTNADREFERTRALIDEGFVDTLGLGPASWGEQAGCWLRSAATPADVPWVRVIDLYRAQVEDGGISSLREVAERALAHSIEDPGLLGEFARDPGARDLIGAYLASHPTIALERGHAARWLAALEAEGQASEGSGRLAWIAYQAGDMDSAERWARLAGPSDALGRWVDAKLTLRSGSPADIEAAREQLATLERSLDPRDDVVIRDWRVTLETAGIGPSTAADEALLAMRSDRFGEALAGLLRAHSWVDAAYVAEQILTIDELREFVDALPDELDDHEVELRWLLARRLARADRWTDALAYYPDELRGEAERERDDLELTHDVRMSAAERAELLWRSGKRMRELGMELTGTELEPDWHYYAGDFAPTPIGEQRLALQGAAKLTAPSREELDRWSRHFDPGMPRFHYRWRAAALGERAAALLPDNHEAGARVLCQAAHWVGARDLDEGNRLTRLMIRRNPDIAIAHYGEHLSDDPVHRACSLDGIDFAGPAYVRPPPELEQLGLFAHVGGLVQRRWPIAIGLASLVLFGLLVLGGRAPTTGPGTRSP